MGEPVPSATIEVANDLVYPSGGWDPSQPGFPMESTPPPDGMAVSQDGIERL